MRGTLRRAVGFALIAGLAACDHLWRVAAGRILVTAPPTVVPFDAPVAAPGPTRELCLVGSPGNIATLWAAGGSTVVRAVLIATDGARDTLRSIGDRRGPEAVCLEDNALRDRPAPPGQPVVTYRAVELSATEFVRLRELWWWSGRRPNTAI